MQPLLRHDTRVGGDAVALAQDEEVSRHDLVDGDLALATAPDDGRDRMQCMPQREHRPLRSGFLNEAEHAVQDDDRSDHAGLQVLSDESRDRGRPKEERDERVGELPARDRQVRRPLGCGKTVRSGLAQKLLGAHLAQPVGKIERRILREVIELAGVRRGQCPRTSSRRARSSSRWRASSGCVGR